MPFDPREIVPHRHGSNIGEDNRHRVLDTTIAPAKMICRLTAHNKLLGTGWFAGPRTVITAAHCVDSTLTGRATTITVIPGCDDKEHPFRELRSTRVAISERWRLYRDDDYDYAVIHLDAAADAVTKKTGWFDLASLDDAHLNGQNVTIPGYPSEKDRQQWSGTSKITDVTAKYIHYDIDTTPGESGAPIYIPGTHEAPDRVVGIHVRGGPKGNEGIRITEAVRQELNGRTAGSDFPDDPCRTSAREHAKEHAYALLIGVGDYSTLDPSGRADLAGSHIDAQAWWKVCENWGFAPKNVQVLTSPALPPDPTATLDREPTRRPATRESIQAGIAWLKDMLRDTDSRGILVYSGHGHWQQDKGFLLCPSDIDAGLDHAIPLSTLRDFGENVTLVLDCGFSRGPDATKKAKVLPVPGTGTPQEHASQVALHSPQVVDRVFVASAPGEPAYEVTWDGQPRGALTAALTGVLGTWGSFWERTTDRGERTTDRREQTKDRTDLAFHACNRAREELDRQSIRQCPLLLAPWRSPTEQAQPTKFMCKYAINTPHMSSYLLAVGELSAFMKDAALSDSTEYWIEGCVDALSDAAAAESTEVKITAQAAQNPASDYKAWHPQFQGRPCFTASTTPTWRSTTNARLSDSRMLYDSHEMVGVLITKNDVAGTSYTMIWYVNSPNGLPLFTTYALTTKGLKLTKLSAAQVGTLPPNGWYQCESMLKASVVP